MRCGTIQSVTEETWRPLGVDDEDQIAEYDALHDGVPNWMTTPFWLWVRQRLTVRGRYSDGTGNVAMVDYPLAESLCQQLRMHLANVRWTVADYSEGQEGLDLVIKTLRRHVHPLQVADYLLAHTDGAGEDELEELLERSKSAWTVGERAGRPGLVRRVPLGVQAAADATMGRAGRAGVRLARAWGELYGLQPDPSAAYRNAILAVEDVAIPVVSPKNDKATLGTVLSQIESQGDWSLPMDREHPNAPSGDVLRGMMRMLWHGQHDRHGGQPPAPGNVSMDEATVAVGLAVTLVQWFDAGLPRRSP